VLEFAKEVVVLDTASAVNRRIAMLIDGDNAQASLMGKMLAETSKYGVVTIRRIYGDWTETNMKSWKNELHTHAIQPIQQFRYTTGKNATDSAMIIDAMDILYTTGVDGFCIVSSDSDYTRLATRIREKNLFVMGIGKQNTPRSFVNACDVFVYTQNLSSQEIDQPAPTSPPAAAAPESVPSVTEITDTQALQNLFRTAYELTMQEDGWAFLGAMGNKLRQLDPSFDPRTYGHKQLLSLIKAHPEMFEIRRTKERGAANIYVRLKQAA
jgi:uncharacterized LabA/DUF88 family protein